MAHAELAMRVDTVAYVGIFPFVLELVESSSVVVASWHSWLLSATVGSTNDAHSLETTALMAKTQRLPSLPSSSQPPSSRH